MKFRNTQISPMLAILGLPILVIGFLMIGITEAIKKLETPFNCVCGAFALLFLTCLTESTKLFDKE